VVPVDLWASGTCARPVTMAFLAGTEPKNTCGPAKSTAPKPDSAPPPTATPFDPTPDQSAEPVPAPPPQAAKPRSESP
jgi:hypothetical protein